MRVRLAGCQAVAVFGSKLPTGTAQNFEPHHPAPHTMRTTTTLPDETGVRIYTRSNACTTRCVT